MSNTYKCPYCDAEVRMDGYWMMVDGKETPFRQWVCPSCEARGPVRKTKRAALKTAKET